MHPTAWFDPGGGRAPKGTMTWTKDNSNYGIEIKAGDSYTGAWVEAELHGQVSAALGLPARGGEGGWVFLSVLLVPPPGDPCWPNCNDVRSPQPSARGLPHARALSPGNHDPRRWHRRVWAVGERQARCAEHRKDQPCHATHFLLSSVQTHAPTPLKQGKGNK